MRRVALVMGLLAAVAIAGGCGGGGDGGGDASESTSANAITKAEFVKQAEAICARAVKKRDAAVKEILKAEGETGEAAPADQRDQFINLISEAVVPPMTQMNEELDELGTPEVGGAKIDAMVQGFASGLAEIEANPAIVIKATTGPFDDPAAVAAELKIESCAGF